MADVSIKYKGAVKAEMNASGTKTIKTAGKYCEGDIEVIYTDPEKPTQSITVTPTAAGFTVTPDSGKVLSSVKVNGDADLVPGNVKNGVNIFGATGTLKTKETVEWHQCPAAVKNFIDNVTYNPADYSTSQIDSYAPASPSISDWKNYATPIGITVDGKEYKNEIPNVETSFSSANTAGTLKPLDQLRWLNLWYLPRNVRDLGGWNCGTGTDGNPCTVKYGKLFRGSELESASERITDADIKLMKDECGIRAELDLRGQTLTRTESVLGEDVKLLYAENGGEYYINYDAIFQAVNRDAVKRTFRHIFENAIYGTPLYFHCTTGADRTGTVALLILGVIGVSQSDIDKDYELTSFVVNRKRTRQEYKNLVSGINALRGNTFCDKCVTFFASLGFTKAEINRFRRAMTNGNPIEVTPTINNYSITKTIVNATIDNASNNIDEYQQYNATVTANNGYTLDGATYSVKMGGVDITATAYNNGVINIPIVTGNIVISVTAVQAAPQYTNQVPISTDASGNIYNGTGYKDGYRLNSSYSESGASGSAVTGFIPFDKSKTLRIHGVTLNDTTAMYVSFFGASKNGLYWVNAKLSGVAQASNDVKFASKTPVTDANGDFVIWDGANQNAGNKWVTLANGNELDNVRYVRISGTCSGADMIVTINEPIT